MIAADVFKTRKATTRAERAVLAATCSFLGALLALSMAGDISMIRPQPWYREFFLPLGVAAAIGAALSTYRPSASAAGYCLLVTAPPYLSFLGQYLRYGEYAGIQRVAGIAVILVLAGSGAAIGFLTKGAFANLRRWRERP